MRKVLRVAVYVVLLAVFVASLVLVVVYSDRDGDDSEGGSAVGAAALAALVEESPDGYAAVEVDKTKDTFDAGFIEEAYASDTQTILLVSGKDGYHGDVRVAVLLEGTVIKKMAGYEISETPGHGDRAFKEVYLSKVFYGIDVADSKTLTMGTRPGGGDVIALTGATVTSKAILNAVNTLIVYYGGTAQA